MKKKRITKSLFLVYVNSQVIDKTHTSFALKTRLLEIPVE